MRRAAPTCTWWAGTSPPCVQGTCWGTSSWEPSPMWAPGSRSTRSVTVLVVLSRAVNSAGTAGTGCSHYATTATRTRGSPRPCGASRSAATDTRTPWTAGRAAARYIRVPYADQWAFAIPDNVSDERAGTTASVDRETRDGAPARHPKADRGVSARKACVGHSRPRWLIDKVPAGAFMHEGLTTKTGPCHVHRCDSARHGRHFPSLVVTHRMEVDRALEGYEIFEHKQDTCVKVVVKP